MNMLFAVVTIFVPILLDKYFKFDRMIYGIISTVFGWISAIIFSVILIEMKG